MISVYTLEESEEWKRIVKSFGKYDVYYLPNYVEAFRIHGDGEPHLIYYNNNEIKAINVVMKRDVSNIQYFQEVIPAGKYFDFSTPYGYGGFLIEGEIDSANLELFKKTYEEYCSKNNIISEFVRFHPLLENEKKLHNIYEIQDLGNTVAMDLTTPEEIWNNLVSKNRNVVRKAIKNGVDIYWGRDLELIKKFIPLYNQTMDTEDATNYYYFNDDFYKSVLDDLKYDMLFFYAVFEEEIISMAMVLLGDNYMHYHLSASDKRYQRYAPNNLLLYEAACWGSENNYTKFHLGGGVGSKEDSLYKFKKRFSKNDPSSYSIGKKIFNKEIYEYLLDIRKKLDNNNFDLQSTFFPLYRQ